MPSQSAFRPSFRHAFQKALRGAFEGGFPGQPLGQLGAVEAIYCIGDSFILGESGPPPIPTVLAALSGLAVTNGGVNGDTAEQIAARWRQLDLSARQQYPVVWDQPLIPPYSGTLEQLDAARALAISAFVSAHAGMIRWMRRADGIRVLVIPANRYPYDGGGGGLSELKMAHIEAFYAGVNAAMRAAFSPAILYDFQDWATNPRRYTPATADDATDQDGTNPTGMPIIPRSMRNDVDGTGDGDHLNAAGHAWAAYGIWHALNRQINPADYALVNDCIACWRMDELSNPDVLLDCAGTHDGATANKVGINRVGGLFGNCLSFSSNTSARAAVPWSADLNPSGSFSLSVWAAPDEDGDRIVDCWASNPNGGGFMLRTDTGNVLKWIVGAAATSITAAYVPGAWHHVYAYFDSARGKIGIEIGINMMPQTSLASVTWKADVPFMLAASTGNSATFKGKLQQLGFWGRLLTEAERATIYNSGSGRRIPGL